MKHDSNNHHGLEKEARLFSNYLIGSPGTEQSFSLYNQAVGNIDQASSADLKVLVFINRNPWSIHAIDSYHALFKPESELRRRLFILLSILETQPEYADDFLPSKLSPLYFAFLAVRGIIAASLILPGFVLDRAAEK